MLFGTTTHKNIQLHFLPAPSSHRVSGCDAALRPTYMLWWKVCDMCHIWINVFFHFCFSAFKKHVRVITTNICYTSEKKDLSLFFLLSICDNGDNISQQTGKWALRGSYSWIPGVGGETSVLWINDSDMDGGLKRSVTVLFSNFSLTGWLNNDKHTLLHSRPIYRLHCKSQTKAAKTATRYEFRQSAYMIMNSFHLKSRPSMDVYLCAGLLLSHFSVLKLTALHRRHLNGDGLDRATAAQV